MILKLSYIITLISPPIRVDRGRDGKRGLGTVPVGAAALVATTPFFPAAAGVLETVFETVFAAGAGAAAFGADLGAY